MDALLAGDLLDWQGWLVLGLVLGVAEILVPGIFLIWVATAAAITGVITYFLPIPLPLQVAIFAALCVAATYAGRRWYANNPVASQDPKLNDRTARLIGQLVTVSEAVQGGQGRVKVGDSAWLCKGPDAPVGAHVRVVGADGSVLIVEPEVTDIR
ncbi:MAG: NfeD family protein [Sphingobium sp.]